MNDQSVVVTTMYNAESTIASCASSVKRVYPDATHVVVDDGSTDGSVQALRGSVFDGVLITRPREGRAAALNTAFDAAAAYGAEAANIDADDLLLPSHREAIPPPTGVAVTGVDAVVLQDDQAIIRRGPRSNEAIRKAMAFSVPITNSGAIYDIDAVLSVGGFRDLPALLDYDLWSRLMEAGFECVSLPIIGVIHHKYRDSYFTRVHRNEFARSAYTSRVFFQYCRRNHISWIPAVARYPYRFMPSPLRRAIRRDQAMTQLEQGLLQTYVDNPLSAPDPLGGLARQETSN